MEKINLFKNQFDVQLFTGHPQEQTTKIFLNKKEVLIKTQDGYTITYKRKITFLEYLSDNPSHLEVINPSGDKIFPQEDGNF